MGRHSIEACEGVAGSDFRPAGLRRLSQMLSISPGEGGSPRCCASRDQLWLSLA